MAQGDLRGNLTASVNSVTNPTNLTGSVAVSLRDLIFVAFSQQTNLTATTVTDNLGNTYSAVNAGTDAGTATLRCYYAPVTVAGTLTQISVAATASTNDASGVAAVIEGPFWGAPLDANPANTSDATTPFTCPATGTLAQADEVIMAAIAVASNQTVAATSPFTLSGTVARANISTGVSRQKVSATTTQTPEFTGTSATSVQTTASFKLAKIMGADAGSYTLTGTDASLERGREVVAEAGSYTLTGTDAGLNRGKRIIADAGSYALTGVDASLELGREVVAELGTYALTGTTANLEFGREIVPDSGSYALTGVDASLEYGREVAADPGSYALSGQDATLTYTPSSGTTLSADAGSYTLTGTDATLSTGVAVCTPAFQTNAFQNTAFQVCAGGGGVCIPAFQPTGFQNNAFQVCPDAATTTQRSQLGGGGWKKRREKERAKLIWSLLPKREKKEEIVEAAIEQALESVPSAPLMSEAAIEQAAIMLLQEQSLSNLKRIKYAETLIDRVQRVMAEMDDEEVILMALH